MDSSCVPESDPTAPKRPDLDAQEIAILDLFIPRSPLVSRGAVPPANPGHFYSSLPTIRKWIWEKALVSGENGLDFLFVEFAPWFDAWDGRKGLSQEIILCAHEDSRFGADELERALRRYAGALDQLQERSLVLFLHPFFTGQ